MTRRIYNGIVILVLLTVAVAVVMFLVRYWDGQAGEYDVVDSFADSSTAVTASVYFIRVDSYDSLAMLGIASDVYHQVTRDGDVGMQRDRDFLFYFFRSDDKQELTAEVVEELAYTHPQLKDPSKKLVAVIGGYVVRAQYKAHQDQPTSVITGRQTFYMPREGVKATDIR